MPVTIGLAEETLYRGYLQPRLAGVLGQARAVIAASAFFAVQHIAFAPFDPRAMIFGIVRTFLAGLVFAGLFLWRRRVMPLAVGHWLLDLLGLGLPARPLYCCKRAKCDRARIVGAMPVIKQCVKC